jgi:hypothetical protein
VSLSQVPDRDTQEEPRRKLEALAAEVESSKAKEAEVTTKLDEIITKLDKAALDIEEIKSKQKSLNRRMNE